MGLDTLDTVMQTFIVIMVVICCGGMFLVCCFLLGKTIKRYFARNSKSRYPFVFGKVTRARLLECEGSSSSSIMYTPDIAYEYLVGGKKFTSERIDAYYDGFGSSRKNTMQRFMAKYTEGALVKVYFDPNNPEYAYLVEKLPVEGIFLFVYIVVIVGGVFFVWKYFA